jgi:hypothetical protein
MAKAWKQSAQELDWDLAPPPFTMLPGPALESMGVRVVQWPGAHLPDDQPYQFVEAEYMLAGEYGQFFDNPGDFVARTVLPRMADRLQLLATLPAISSEMLARAIKLLRRMAGLPALLWGPLLQLGTGAAAAAYLPAADVQVLKEAAVSLLKWYGVQQQLGQDLEALGYPLVSAFPCVAPFDLIANFLRGLRGVMLDIYREPKNLMAAMEMLTPAILRYAIEAAQETGNPRVFIPLHRGAKAFMSDEHFATFYWPGLRTLLLGLIEAGLTPLPFFEGDYTPRLDFLTELPPGKVLAHFDQVDLDQFQAKLGDRLCFWGNVPAQLLILGKPEEVTDYVRMLIDRLGANGGLIVDGAVDGVPAESRPENVAAMTEAVLRYES